MEDKRIGIKLTGREESDTRKTHLRCTCVSRRESMVKQRITVRKSTHNDEVTFLLHQRQCLSASMLASMMMYQVIYSQSQLQLQLICSIGYDASVDTDASDKLLSFRVN